MSEKRKIKVLLTREIRFEMEKDLTKEEYDDLKETIENGTGQDGAAIMSAMGRDPAEHPDDWSDESEIEELNGILKELDVFTIWGGFTQHNAPRELITIIYSDKKRK